MSLFNFANIEKRINTKVLARFANISLIDADDAPVLAILNEDISTFGEVDLTYQGSKQLVFDKSIYPNLAVGAVLSPNPLQYTPAELAAMPTSYTLDKLAEDDGYQQTWWVL